jgi:glycosyltransferase involved in cell wall biosynthesis
MRYRDADGTPGVGVLDVAPEAESATKVLEHQSPKLAGIPTIDVVHPPFPSTKQALRVMFVQTDMRVGGAEMVTANIIRRLDRARFSPELCCLKELGEIGEQLADEVPTHHGLLRNKYDLRVLPRLIWLLRRRKIDAIVTVGAGDKMFWGRLAARQLRLPVIISALHSTGWPDGVGRLNRMLTPITDAFIAVAASHGKYLVEREGFPAERVAVIANGVDTQKYAPMSDATEVRRELGIASDAPVVGIVAALRPEKNHELFIEMARRVVSQLPAARFLIVGDGPCRADLERRCREMSLESNVLFVGSRNDVPRLLAATDVFALTSHNEANPISILEAMSVGLPVVSTNVGSIHEAVSDGITGNLVPAGNGELLAARVLGLLTDLRKRRAMGTAARNSVVDAWSIESMVSGYEQLIESIYRRNSSVGSRP